MNSPVATLSLFKNVIYICIMYFMQVNIRRVLAPIRSDYSNLFWSNWSFGGSLASSSRLRVVVGSGAEGLEGRVGRSIMDEASLLVYAKGFSLKRQWRRKMNKKWGKGGHKHKVNIFSRKSSETRKPQEERNNTCLE